MTYPRQWGMKFEESRVSLQDSMIWSPSKSFSFLNLALDEMNSQLTAIDRNSLFEVSIGLAQMVTKENIVQVGDIVPVITMVGALLFLAGLIVQAFNFVFLSKLLDFEIVKSVYKFAVNDSFKYHS